MSDKLREMLERLKITISGGLCYFTAEAKHEQLKNAMAQVDAIINDLFPAQYDGVEWSCSVCGSDDVPASFRVCGKCYPCATQSSINKRERKIAGLKRELAVLSAQQADVEPDAWSYELAHGIAASGVYSNWESRLSRNKPCVPDGSIRNMKPLYGIAPISVSGDAKSFDWGRLVQCILRCMDASIKNESSREQAERIATTIEDSFTAPSSQSAEMRELIDRYTVDIVKNAMLTMWNDICADTDCHPLDIEHSLDKRLTFTPRHWAEAVGKMARQNVLDLIRADEGKESEDDHRAIDRGELAPPDTTPTLLAMLEKAKSHVMSPEEIYEQRRSFVRGMCPFSCDYNEWCAHVDKLLPPMFKSAADVSREEIAKIIDPNSFMDIPFTDDPIFLGMVEQSKADAFCKAGKILALFGKGKKTNDG